MLKIFFPLLFVALCSAQPIPPDSVWTFSLDDGGDEYFYDAIEVEDGYLLCGEAREWNALTGEALLVKIDRAGELVWSRRYPGAIPIRFRYIIYANSDGTEFEVLTEELSASGIAEDILYLWFEELLVPEYDFTICNLPVNSGTTTASATIDNGTLPDEYQAEVVTHHYMDRDTLEHVRTDDGDHQCITVPNFGEYEITDGLWYSNLFSSVVLCGYRQDTAVPFHAQGFLGFIAGGGPWEFGGIADDVFNAVQIRSTSSRLWGFGWTESFGNGARDMWILGYDVQGNDTISVTFGGLSNEDAVEAFLASDEGFIIAGNFSSEDIEFEQSDFWLLKVGETGDSMWSVLAGGEEADRCEGMIETENGFLLFGASQSFTAPGWDGCAMLLAYVPDLAAAPSTLNFGAMMVGDSVVRTLNLINTGSNTLTVASIGGADAYHAQFAGPATIDVSDTLAVNVYFAPTVAGTQIDTLIVMSDAISGVKHVRCLGAGVAAAADEEEAVPSEFALHPPYPNPFNAETVIEFALPRASTTTLKLYDATGRLVRTLVDERRVAGTYRHNLNATGLASGSYFVTLTAGKYHATQKLVVLK